MTTRYIIPSLLFACGLALTGPAVAGVAIIGGTVHTVTSDEPLQEAVILVDQGRIQAVGANLEIPSGYERVNASGKMVTPGLIEPYSQLGLMEIAGEDATVDARVSVATTDASVEPYRLGPGFDVQYAINPDSALLPVNRVEGVARAVVAPVPGNDPLAGWGAAIRLGEGEVLTHSRLALFGQIDAGAATLVGGSRSAVIQRLRLALEQARNYRPSRYQPEEGDYRHQDMAALRSFLASGAPLVLTVHRANEILQAVNLARDFGVRVVIHGGAEAWKVADALAQARVPVIVDVLDNLPLSYDQLGARLDNATILFAAGVPVLFTAEETHNARLLRQVAGNAVAEGMPWPAALASVTRRPAEVFGLGEGVGTLAPGAPADLVIWSGDPLELTTWAERVMIDGQWIPMESRQTRLLERYRELDGGEPFGYR